MSVINFKKGCRDCQKTDGFTNTVTDLENDLDYYKTITDFEVFLDISEWLRSNHVFCDFCGGSNFDISDIRVDNYPMFELNRLEQNYEKHGIEFFIINVIKNNSDINPDLGGNDDNSDEFLKLCKIETIRKIKSFSPSHYEQHDNGIFFICFSGNEQEVQLEKFRFSGFRQDQLITLTEIIFKNLYI